LRDWPVSSGAEERKRAAAFGTSSSKSKSAFVQIVLVRTTDFDNLLRRSADKRRAY